MLGVDYQLKNFFFDRPKIKLDVAKKTRRALGYAGGNVRRVARRSMKSGKKARNASAAGTPPNYHSRDQVATLKNILFGYLDFGVIVGPVRLNQKSGFGGGLQSGVVPQVQEFGGTLGHQEKFAPFSMTAAIEAFGAGRARLYAAEFGIFPSGFHKKHMDASQFERRVDRAKGGIWLPVGRRRRDRFLTRSRQAKYPPRPYMAPAVKTVMNDFPNLYVRTSAAGTLFGNVA
jgi:hypothetical protein